MFIIKTDCKKKNGWKVFFRHLLTDHLFESAATLSYYFLFSVFPLAIFISASFATLQINPEDLSALSGFVPMGILNILENYLREISFGSSTTLILTGMILTLYSMGKAIQTMKRKFRLAYHAKTSRQTFSEWVVSLVFVLLVMISFYAMLIIIVAGNYIFQWLISIFPFLATAFPSFQLIRLFAVTCYLFFVLLGLYFVLPGIKQNRRDILPGTLFSLASWVLMSYLFSLYLETLGSFTPLYGSLGAIIALLTWLFLINLILLLGAKINSYFYFKKSEENHDQHDPLLH